MHTGIGEPGSCPALGRVAQLSACAPQPATKRHPKAISHNAATVLCTMSDEYEQDEHYEDDYEEEEEEQEVILTHAEHKAQGNDLYKSKGT